MSSLNGEVRIYTSDIVTRVHNHKGRHVWVVLSLSLLSHGEVALSVYISVQVDAVAGG